MEEIIEKLKKQNCLLCKSYINLIVDFPKSKSLYEESKNHLYNKHGEII